MSRRRCLRPRLARLVLAASVTALGGCREEVDPFAAKDRGPTPAQQALRLTYSGQDDRTPSWSADGDTVYYSTDGFDGFPDQRGVLVALSRNRGVARQLLPNAQVPGGEERWLLAPRLEPGGERLAFVEMGPLWPADACPGTTVTCDPPADPSLPPLREVTLRVRRFDAVGPLESTPSHFVRVPGVRFDFSPTPKFHVVANYPFHQLFEQERAAIFRPDWAPDGDSLVYSDGSALFIWQVGSANAQPIPNSEDGVGPAWSPDGDWIAFSRLERADSSGTTCTYDSGFPGAPPPCIQERTDYIPGPRVLTLIRPDGSAVRELGEGDEPAWAPDGSALYYRHDGSIWRTALDGTGSERLDFSDGGREPAVSPDGRFLAIARLSPDGDDDIWVLSLD